MDELAYRFLLQSGYPRAALVQDLTLLSPAHPPDAADTADAAEPARRPALAVVDPVTGDRLALVYAVGALDAGPVRAAADELVRHAQRFGGESVQGLLLRIDLDGTSPDEQMQVYRAWPTPELERVSLRTFPDLDALRTWRLLAERRRTAGRDREPLIDDPADRPDAPDAPPAAHAPAGRRVGAGIWLPGALLAVVALADWALGRTGAGRLLDTAQALLLVGAVALLFGAALARARRD